MAWLHSHDRCIGMSEHPISHYRRFLGLGSEYQREGDSSATGAEIRSSKVVPDSDVVQGTRTEALLI